MALSLIDNAQFDTVQGKFSDIIQISGSVFAVVYSGSGDDGWLKTISIAADGTIGSVIDKLEFDTVICTRPKIIHLSGTMYAIAYTGYADDGFLVTIDIQDDGTIAAAVTDSWEFDTDNGKFISIINISGTIYALAFSGSGSDGFVKTLTIANDGTITKSWIGSYEFNTIAAAEIIIRHITGDIYAIVYQNNSNYGQIITVDIATDGTITTPMLDSFVFESADCIGLNSELLNISGTMYAIFYRRSSDGTLHLATFNIAADGTIDAAVTDSYEIPTGADLPEMILYSSGIYLLVYETSTPELEAIKIPISNAGIIGAITDTLTVDTGSIVGISLVQRAAGIFIIAYDAIGGEISTIGEALAAFAHSQAYIIS